MVGTFERSVRLPEFVNADRIAASFSNGLITIAVPKAEAAQPPSVPGRPASCPSLPHGKISDQGPRSCQAARAIRAC
jgi:hypothetical protein